MRRFLSILLAVAFCTALASAQTAEELVAKNLAAKGGIDKINIQAFAAAAQDGDRFALAE